MPRPRVSPSTAIAAVALVVATGGLAFAAIPDGSGIIHACYTTGAGAGSSGAVRLVDANVSCAAGEAAITWNQAGRPGTPGSDGAPGPAGPQGPQGPAGPQGTGGGQLMTSAPVGHDVVLTISGKVVSKPLKLPEGHWMVFATGNVEGGVYDSSYKYGRVECTLYGFIEDSLQGPETADAALLRFAKVTNSLRKQGQHLVMTGDLHVPYKGYTVRAGCGLVNQAMKATVLGGVHIYAMRVSG